MGQFFDMEWNLTWKVWNLGSTQGICKKECMNLAICDEWHLRAYLLPNPTSTPYTSTGDSPMHMLIQNTRSIRSNMHRTVSNWFVWGWSGVRGVARLGQYGDSISESNDSGCENTYNLTSMIRFHISHYYCATYIFSWVVFGKWLELMVDSLPSAKH